MSAPFAPTVRYVIGELEVPQRPCRSRRVRVREAPLRKAAPLEAETTFKRLRTEAGKVGRDPQPTRFHNLRDPRPQAAESSRLNLYELLTRRSVTPYGRRAGPT